MKRGSVGSSRRRLRAACLIVVLAALQMSRGEIVEQAPLIVSAEPLVPVVARVGEGGLQAALLVDPSLDLQSQGVPGGQSDLSIRGSSFSGAGITLQGLAVPNAQTEHWQTDLPFVRGVFGRPRVLTGFEQSVNGTGYLVGSVELSVQPLQTRRLAAVGLSEDASIWGELLLQEQQQMRGLAYGVGGFASGGEIRSVDLLDNDVAYRLGGGQFQIRNQAGDQTDVLVGHQFKRLGVRGYYGVTPDWDGEEETEDTMVFVATQRSRAGGDIRASAYYREFEDTYRLLWSLPGIFENEHRLQTLGGMVDGQWRPVEDEMYWLDWSLGASDERIRSSALGHFDRQQMHVLVVPGVRAGRWRYQAGGRMDVFSEHSDELLPQASVTYVADSGVSVQLAYSESVRQPSYTELNYESPASLGNAGLENQQAATTELLLQGDLGASLVWEMGGFQRETHDTVDWIRRDAAASRWEAANIGTVTTWGVEVGGRWVHTGGSFLALHYLGLDKPEDAGVYASRYALDYARHRLRIQALWALGSRVTLGYDHTFRQQEEHPLREGGHTQTDGSLQVRCRVLEAPLVHAWASVENIWDDDYQVFPGQETIVPRRYASGLSMEW